MWTITELPGNLIQFSIGGTFPRTEVLPKASYTLTIIGKEVVVANAANPAIIEYRLKPSLVSKVVTDGAVETTTFADVAALKTALDEIWVVDSESVGASLYPVIELDPDLDDSGDPTYGMNLSVSPVLATIGWASDTSASTWPVITKMIDFKPILRIGGPDPVPDVNDFLWRLHATDAGIDTGWTTFEDCKLMIEAEFLGPFPATTPVRVYVQHPDWEVADGIGTGTNEVSVESYVVINDLYTLAGAP